MAISLESPITEEALTTVRSARLTHTALHEAAHCVIACDMGYQVIRVKLDRKRFGGWMMNSDDGEDLVKDAQISLAGVSFERMVWGNYRTAYSWCGGDFRYAYEALQKDESISWENPRFRNYEETAILFKKELHHIEMRLIKLWPVIEYVAACILKNRKPIFPERPGKWSDKVRRCINDPRYLKQHAPWANYTLPSTWLNQLIAFINLPRASHTRSDFLDCIKKKRKEARC